MLLEELRGLLARYWRNSSLERDDGAGVYKREVDMREFVWLLYFGVKNLNYVF